MCVCSHSLYLEILVQHQPQKNNNQAVVYDEIQIQEENDVDSSKSMPLYVNQERGNEILGIDNYDHIDPKEVDFSSKQYELVKTQSMNMEYETVK